MDLVKKDKNSYRTLWIIRVALIIPIIITTTLIGVEVFKNGVMSGALSIKSSNLQTLFETIVALLLTFIPEFIEKHRKVKFPNVLEISLALFIYTALFLGSALRFYMIYWWWDDIIHALSGVIAGVIGFLLIYYINGKHNIRLNSSFIAFFVFAFGLAIGALWELFEFLSDVIFGTAMQQWNLPANTILMGNENQGIGLRDSMSDLLFDSIGSLIVSIFIFLAYDRNKNKVVKIIKKIFPKK